MLGISLTGLAIGLGTAPALFDYYVDPASGNDTTGDGSITAPYATLSKALTVIGSATGKKVGLKRGTTLRNDPVTISAASTYLGAYGTGAAPAHYGSSQTAVSSFTKVGNLYTLTGFTFDPFTLALVSGSGAVTKLEMTANSGTVSAADPSTENTWTWFPGTHTTPNILKFYSSATLTGFQVEVPQGGSEINGIACTADNCTVDGVSVRFWSGAGNTVGAGNMTWTGIDSSYNGADGIDADQNSTGFLCMGSSANYNGRRYGAGGGPGDGFSAHSVNPNGASGTVIGCTFIGNTQTGIGCQSGCQITSRYCYFEDNYWDIYTYNVADALIGSHDHAYHKIVHKTLGQSFYNANGTAGDSNEATTVKLRNLSVYYAAGVTVSTAAYQAQGFTNTLESLALKMGGTCSWFGWCIQSGANLTKLTSTNNSINGFSSGVWQLIASTFTVPTTETGALTTDPLFTSAATYDLTLQAGSPCIDSGANWGQTQDYTGKTITGTPDRGAYER